MLRLVETGGEADAPRSQTSMAYARVRADVLGGRLAPGERLKISDLAQQLGVSPGAIREALSRLVPEGLVVSRDQKGFVVAPLSGSDLDDLAQMRCDIEELALRRSLGAGDADWEATILAEAHRLRRLPRFASAGRPDPDWLRQHDRFHAALVGACASPRLLALRSQLHEQSERYRILSSQVEGDRDVPGEHQAMVDAALDRDVETLVALSKAHIRQTAVLLKKGFTPSGSADATASIG